mmetsp:Transcript_82720/g.138025  ORF Transcript_82720/g.138025 Transcript_82720/m.138025 type:complete len:220 (+) Transcript_82720:1207-1866(+)
MSTHNMSKWRCSARAHLAKPQSPACAARTSTSSSTACVHCVTRTTRGIAPPVLTPFLTTACVTCSTVPSTSMSGTASSNADRTAMPSHASPSIMASVGAGDVTLSLDREVAMREAIGLPSPATRSHFLSAPFVTAAAGAFSHAVSKSVLSAPAEPREASRRAHIRSKNITTVSLVSRMVTSASIWPDLVSWCTIFTCALNCRAPEPCTTICPTCTGTDI